MSNYRRICPACGSASVAYATPLSIPLPVDRRCKACGTVWRMPRGITESIVAMLFGAALALYAGVGLFLIAADFFLSEIRFLTLREIQPYRTARQRRCDDARDDGRDLRSIDRN